MATGRSAWLAGALLCGCYASGSRPPDAASGDARAASCALAPMQLCDGDPSVCWLRYTPALDACASEVGPGPCVFWYVPLSVEWIAPGVARVSGLIGSPFFGGDVTIAVVHEVNLTGAVPLTVIREYCAGGDARTAYELARAERGGRGRLMCAADESGWNIWVVPYARDALFGEESSPIESAPANEHAVAVGPDGRTWDIYLDWHCPTCLEISSTPQCADVPMSGAGAWAHLGLIRPAGARGYFTWCPVQALCPAACGYESWWRRQARFNACEVPDGWLDGACAATSLDEIPELPESPCGAPFEPAPCDRQVCSP